MNYSIKHKTPLKWGLYWMVLRILGLSGGRIDMTQRRFISCLESKIQTDKR